jgi:hypothetical protein
MESTSVLILLPLTVKTRLSEGNYGIIKRSKNVEFSADSLTIGLERYKMQDELADDGGR